MDLTDKLKKAFLAKRNHFAYRASCNDLGITQITENGPVHINWQDVTAIVAYKKDCFSVDQIRLEIKSMDQSILCTEEDQDLEELGKVIASHLPGSLPDWYAVVAGSPAFDLTFTRVYP